MALITTGDWAGGTAQIDHFNPAQTLGLLGRCLKTN